jgi:uncharacterized protein (DUF305 family)
VKTPVLLLTLAVACSPGPAGRASDTTAIAADSSPAAGPHDMAGMPMTGDADRDFLVMMSGHHKGLIALAHESMLRGSRGTIQSQDDARILDARQDRELEQMIAMLKATYQDSAQPRVRPADQAMIDSLLRIPGPAYALEFYRAVVAQHRRAVGMIDEYLPNAKRADLKALAERMRSDHLAEIREFERKVK